MRALDYLSCRLEPGLDIHSLSVADLDAIETSEERIRPVIGFEITNDRCILVEGDQGNPRILAQRL